MDGEDVDRLDRALVHLRRLWGGPPPATASDGRRIEMSSLLLLEAWTQLADSEHAAVSVGALRRFAAVRPSTATRLVDRAVEAGLLVRVPGSGDSRHRFVTAADAGKAARRQAVLVRTTWLRRILEPWSDADVHAFATLLERFSSQVQASGGPAVDHEEDGARPADGA